MRVAKLQNWIIRPGLGLGDLFFGASRLGVLRYLGDAEEVSEDQSGSGYCITWYYWTLGITAHFDSEDHFRLGTLNIERNDAELFGLRLIGLPEDRVRSLLVPFALGPDTFEVMSHADFMSLLTYPEQDLYFWFHNGHLNNIQWGYLIGEDDQIIWPSQSEATV